MQYLKLWITLYFYSILNINPKTELDITKANPTINKPITALVIVEMAS